MPRHFTRPTVSPEKMHRRHRTPVAAWVYAPKMPRRSTSPTAPKRGGMRISRRVAPRSTRNTAPCGAPCSSRSLRPGVLCLRCFVSSPVRGGARLRGEAVPDSQAAYRLALDAVSQTLDLGSGPRRQLIWECLYAYVEDIPTYVLETIASRAELVGEDGQLYPYGVIAGMVFAMVTRASYGSRLGWFQPLDWSKVSCVLCE